MGGAGIRTWPYGRDRNTDIWLSVGFEGLVWSSVTLCQEDDVPNEVLHDIPMKELLHRVSVRLLADSDETGVCSCFEL